jgi:hypothetical protein
LFYVAKVIHLYDNAVHSDYFNISLTLPDKQRHNSLKAPVPPHPTAKVINPWDITKHPDHFNICLTQKTPNGCDAIREYSDFG